MSEHSSKISIQCPACSHKFELGEDIKKSYQAQMQVWKKQKEEEYKQKETQLQQQLQQKDVELEQKIVVQKQQWEQQFKTTIQQQLSTEYQTQIQHLQQSVNDSKLKIEEARKKELEFLQKEQQLKNKEEEIELNIQKRLLQEREQMSESLRKIELQRFEQLELEYKHKLAEKEKQLEQQKNLAEQMRKKAEQGSMQLQGEMREIALEELLQSSFPYDVVAEVPKGVRGADCLLNVNNKLGVTAGTIIFESKNTQAFANEWIEKLKTDMRSQNADVAVLVTTAMPKDMDRFGEKEGIYICNFVEVKSVVTLLRNAILKMHDLRKSQENKGDKMVMLYNYLTGGEFAEQWLAVREGFLQLRQSIQKERDVMEKIWKTREKQLEKILLNATHIQGSVEGISGTDSINLDLLEF